MDNLLSNPFLLHNLASSFTRFVLHPNNRNIFVPAAHSFLCGDAVESSEQLLDAVKKAKETHSMETVRNAFYDWTEWVTMMKTIEKDAAQRSDLSFLQSRCLRSTLSLQTKHQLRANPTPIEENRFADSCHFTTTTDALLSPQPSPPKLTSNPNNHHPLLNISLRSNFVPSKPCPTHYLLTRPPPDSFSWNTRPSIESESELDADFQLDSLSVDLHEKFHTSLFDETDDTKLVAALRRCHAVVEATKSTKCISDVHTFRSLLLAGLHSPHTIVQFECFDLFFELEDYIPTVNDPRDVRFACLRMAFQEGTFWEKMTLLWLWERWLNFGAKNGDRKDMNESDFDFSDPVVFLKVWSDVSECTSRKFLFTPYVAQHQPPFESIFSKSSTALVFISPFGACFSLVKVFRMLYPSNMNENPDEPQILCQVGDVVVSLHWFNIPSHFDSPPLPSSFSGWCSARRPPNSLLPLWHPSLISPYNLQPDWNRIRVVLKKDSLPVKESTF
ncbi:hypothetical protein BLNAU_24055 [Blattamonas nauphoetae]|uniref:Uncharacterized protein n=1 Tax=Blattamonas nauphoetae TaxID=2049346 RepID=A0ABQ9WNH7_9EUKA|nr:hypothetical protein BLNAU_24055 [Blattamonas nauphoetae]